MANRTENERETLAADYRLSADVCHTGESAVVSGHEDKCKHEYSPRAEESLEKLNAKTWGVRYHEDSSGVFLCSEGMKAETNWTGDNGKLSAVETDTGVTEHDGAGKHLLNAIEQLQQDL